MRAGSAAMMARRCSTLSEAQLAISAIVRPQPTHKPVSSSSRQTLTQGVSKEGFVRLLVPDQNVGTAARPGNYMGQFSLLPYLPLVGRSGIALAMPGWGAGVSPHPAG
jgi:hypothetical protein